MSTDRAPLRLGTRKSLMATTQSQLVADALSQRTGLAVELVGVTTQGDVSKALLAQMGGTGVFVSELRDRVLSGEVDFAVHSLKDLPTGAAEGITLAATPRRDDPRDALCGPAKLADLPRGARVGTGSPRRVAQLLALRPDLEVVPIRGNADTRLGKVTSGELDAVVLAYAGLTRIGRLEAVAEVFETEQMLPAPGQGSLALECRSDRPELAGLLGTVDDAATRAAVLAERTVLAVLEAGCSAPVGAYAAEREQELHLTANVVSSDGTRQIRLSARGHRDEAERLGRDLAHRMLGLGADQLMGERTIEPR
ncbi:hydroxymethylbilane synthase [Actinomadura macrotermitis]|uniref:Porphobilinogen deaminase n=1 Tax=Actinomadura macrotermitis TaxID=2585200 RepID=A0A7K0BYS4_9ACTN|nr:hydroxymethylbilane synthase [Actinomadura macrotermitis]MQY06012.1 Porphobilinogen deaminase [Actinomadura macrotermitis]